MAGFALLWLHPRTKRPIGDDWSQLPVATLARLEKTYQDGNNIGVRLGKWSKVDGDYLHVLDVDIREGADEDAKATLEDLFPGVDLWRFPRVKSGSGGASRHIYFVTTEPFPSKKLANSGIKFVGEDGKKHWTWEIELFGTGKQVAIPPSVHPDTGNLYAWEREFDLSARAPTIDADLIADLIYGEDEEVDEDVDVEPLGISYKEAEDYLKELDLDHHCEDREGWITVGMALHHEFDGSKEALAVWRDFSKQSRKYDAADLKYQWKSFDRKKTGRPVTFRTVVESANEEIRAQEWANIPDEFDDVEEAPEAERDIADEFEDLPPQPSAAPKLKGVPKHLLTVPGALGRVVDYYNKTAKKPQPQFAVQTALALGSIVLGRNWRTDQDNFTTLFFLNIAPTSSGKEHAKRVVERILEESNESDLVGPKAYTSEAGVMSALLMQPRHISITDEFGRYLASSRASGNANKQDVQSAFMEIFGRLDGVYRGTGYSTHGMTKDQADAVKNRKIVRPALTILGMTTPSTFYEALSGLDVKDGFLNRFLIVNSPVERQLSRAAHLSKVPAAITDWVRDHAWVNASSDEDDMSEVRAKLEPQMVTEPVIVPFAPECNEILQQMELEVLKDMDQLDAHSMAELFGRTIEIAMRVALIVAVSDGAQRVRPKHLEWARDYVFFYHRQMAEHFSVNIGRSEFETVAEAAFDVIKKGGKGGATEREIVHHCRGFKRLDRRFRDEVLSRLKSDYGVAFIDIVKEGRDNNGRKRKAYVAPRTRD